MIASGLPVVGRLLVWAIVLGCLGLFIWRRIQGVPIRDKAKVDDPPGPVPPLESPTASPAPLFPPVGPDAGAAPASPGEVPPAPTGVPTSARGGFFAPAVDQPDATSDPSVPAPTAAGRSTVAEAVQGIVMPCGLSPVVDGSSSLPNPFRVTFLTSLAAAPEVGRALADELERLGFTLTTPATTELLARRDRTELRVVLYPTAASARRGLQQLFPAAGPTAVGVELST
jgi:hypothetical protein